MELVWAQIGIASQIPIRSMGETSLAVLILRLTIELSKEMLQSTSNLLPNTLDDRPSRPTM